MLQLPIWTPQAGRRTSADLFLLLTELQTAGMRVRSGAGEPGLGLHRRGGAGPTDHKAVRIAGQTVMVPVHTAAASRSPFELCDSSAISPLLYRDGKPLMAVELPATPRFYARSTVDGIPYWKIATLHASDVLATTVLQKCVRYGNKQSACQFCAIGQSLKSGATIAEKSPAQLAEVARAAVELDGVKHAVLTTGTPPSDDRGAAVLARASAAIRAAVPLPIQAQCEPPADFAWFARLRDAGVATLGMHLEAVEEPVRARIMPGKAEVPVSFYLEAFAAAVAVFGRGQVTTYILAGLGDRAAAIVAMSERLAALGVYPFVVPFVPVAGTALAAHPAPDSAFMSGLLADVARAVTRHGLRSERIAAGCGRCGACSTQRSAEARHA